MIRWILVGWSILQYNAQETKWHRINNYNMSHLTIWFSMYVYIRYGFTYCWLILQCVYMCGNLCRAHTCCSSRQCRHTSVVCENKLINRSSIYRTVHGKIRITCCDAATNNICPDGWHWSSGDIACNKDFAMYLCIILYIIYFNKKKIFMIRREKSFDSKVGAWQIL